jgi:hypothetical protein
MADNRSLPLPVSFTDDLPACTPSTLEYIQWGDEHHRKLYKIQRTQSESNGEKANAVEFDGTASKKHPDSWSETSILDHCMV